ncbi:MAG: hypothetical protein CMH56_10415 [Myxococcales bacterium]|nr:hypothetical protein [Myxococcales bacterium]|tara:strand:- start:1488 stop:3065 length:1578 start_codon:yes stop_codon:yes gene_type:complete
MTAKGPTPLPKANSASFRKVLKELRDRMDLPTLVVIAEATLDRAELENILQKMLKGRGGHLKKAPQEILIAQVAKAFFASKDSAHSAMRLLDKKALQERNLAASIEEADVLSVLEKMDALVFPNERAKMVWALFRDGRAAHVSVAKSMVTETLQKLQAEQNMGATLQEPEKAEKLLAQMKSTEAHLIKKKKAAETLEQEKGALEQERANLIVRIGQKEVQINKLKDKVADLKSALALTKTRCSDLEEQVADGDVAQMIELRQSNEALSLQVGSLKRKVARMSAGASHEDEAETTQKALLEAEQRIKTLERENEKLKMQWSKELAAAKDRATDLRASLKKARQIAQEVKEAKDQKEEGQYERIGVFIDAANLSASAARVHGGTFDFVGLLNRLGEPQKPAKALAYVVKQKDANAAQAQSFEGFVKSLRFGGYEIRQKTPRLRKDGSTKADWDLGIAMDMVEMVSRLDTIVLGSGDGDFLPVLQFLKRRKKKIIVVAFRHSASEPLLAAADEVILLDESSAADPRSS